MHFTAPAPDYVGPAAHTSVGSNYPIDRLVMHSTVSPCVPGGARSTAHFFNSQAAEGSAHYIVDPDEVVQDVYDKVIAWHAPPNPNSIGTEMCDMPVAEPAHITVRSKKWFALKRVWRWRKPNQRRMLKRAANLQAALALAYGVPVRWLTVSDLKAGKHGITSHNNVSLAFHQSDHWDPGWWPRRSFMRHVKRFEKRQRAGESWRSIDKSL